MVVSTNDRIARAYDIVQFGLIEHVEKNWFRVASQTKGFNFRYFVHVNEYDYCSCPDFGYRMAELGYACKHIIAVYMAWELNK